MKVRYVGYAFVAVLLLSSGGLLWAQQAEGPWIHVEVTGEGENVNLNLPVSFVQALLELAPKQLGGSSTFSGLDDIEDNIPVAALRRIWQSLRSVGDAEFLAIESDEQTVNVAREGDLFRLRVDNQGDEQQVRVEVPVTAVDALFSGDDETLNLRAALEALSQRSGDVVRVDGPDQQIRIWIGER